MKNVKKEFDFCPNFFGQIRFMFTLSFRRKIPENTREKCKQKNKSEFVKKTENIFVRKVRHIPSF